MLLNLWGKKATCRDLLLPGVSALKNTVNLSVPSNSFSWAETSLSRDSWGEEGMCLGVIFWILISHSLNTFYVCAFGPVIIIAFFFRNSYYLEPLLSQKEAEF